MTLLNKIFRIAKAFTDSSMFDKAAPLKSPMREDLSRLLVLLQFTLTEDMSKITGADVDAADSARTALIKAKGQFQSAVTIYPTGVHMCDHVQKVTAQIRKDELLAHEIEAAAEFAKSMKPITRESITKERDGDYDVVIPTMNKLTDMVGKYFSFNDAASDRCKATCLFETGEVEGRIKQLRVALIEAGMFKIEKKFPTFPDMLDRLASNKLGSIADAMQLFGDMGGYQCIPKLPLVKLLGKDTASEIESIFASVASTSKLLQASYDKLAAVASGSVNEDLLTEDRFLSLTQHLNDEKAMATFSTWLPSWASALEKLKSMLSTSILEFTKQTTSTFHGFVLKLLETEINMPSILKSEIVGSIDLEEKVDKDRDVEKTIQCIFHHSFSLFSVSLVYQIFLYILILTYLFI